MKIAIHAADLDSDRIDGTRVYIKNVLNQFGRIDIADDFLIYHKGKFNPELEPDVFDNFQIKKAFKCPFWTQTSFALHLLKDNPDVLWMPVHNLPMIRNTKIKTIVTIHDLAFKFFKESFTKSDLAKLNRLADLAIKKSNKIIAVSQSTKNDILKLYSEIKEEKIKVIHHGFESGLFNKEEDASLTKSVLEKYKIKNKNFLLYVGALQPRKNLLILIDAFEKLKEKGSDLKLVLAGAKAWMWEDIMNKTQKSQFSGDIILTGKVPFNELPILYKNAKIFVFPSLYEGFGIPVLESFVSGTPVICADNSSLPEVGGEAVLYFNAKSADNLAEKINLIMLDRALEQRLIKDGYKQAKKFSWEKCAKETLDYLKN